MPYSDHETHGTSTTYEASFAPTYLRPYPRAMDGGVNLAEQRAREKQESREKDELALQSGKISREELARENGAFAFPRDRVRILVLK